MRTVKRNSPLKIPKAPAKPAIKMKAGKAATAFKNKVVNNKPKAFIPYYGGKGGKMSNGTGWGGK
jgi:hypothetical protein